jgi:hypothetical protein
VRGLLSLIGRSTTRPILGYSPHHMPKPPTTAKWDSWEKELLLSNSCSHLDSHQSTFTQPNPRCMLVSTVFQMTQTVSSIPGASYTVILTLRPYCGRLCPHFLLQPLNLSRLLWLSSLRESVQDTLCDFYNWTLFSKDTSYSCIPISMLWGSPNSLTERSHGEATCKGPTSSPAE